MVECMLGLSQRIFIASGIGEKRDCLSQDWKLSWVRWIALPNRPELAVELARKVGLSGIVLTGGDDIGLFPERDATEVVLVEWCLASSRPLPGIPVYPPSFRRQTCLSVSG